MTRHAERSERMLCLLLATGLLALAASCSIPSEVVDLGSTVRDGGDAGRPDASSGIVGQLDTTFAAPRGFVTGTGYPAGQYGVGLGIAVDSTDRVVGSGMVFAAASTVSERDMVVWRLTREGAPDSTFNGTGFFLEHLSRYDWGFDVLVDPSDRILVGGYEERSYRDNPTIWRITASGVLDTTFGVGGSNSVFFDPEVEGDGIARDPTDGSYVVSGRQHSAFMAAVRFTAEGAVDPTFNGTGKVVFDAIPNSSAFRVAVDSQGRVLLVGQASPGGKLDTDLIVWRYNHDGTPDTSFAGLGYALHDSPGGILGANDLGNDLALSPEGGLYVAGQSNQRMAVWKLKGDGTLDASFCGAGCCLFSGAAGGSGPDLGTAIAIDASGRLVVAGSSRNAAGDDDLAVWRITPDGALDPAFGIGGVFVHGGAAGGVGGTDLAHDVALDSTGRILVIGESADAALASQMVIWRLR
ncbi:MAG: hypothetical protein QM765_51865 [Myxococcales bacterium]